MDIKTREEQIREAKQLLKEERAKVKKKISRSKIFGEITKNLRTWQLLGGFLALFLVMSVVILLVEPQINNWGDSLWFCFVTTSTIGYGEMVATTVAGRICVVILSLYSIIITAIITSVLVTYHNEVNREQKALLKEFDEDED